MPSAAAALWFEQALSPSGWADRVRVAISDGRVTWVEAGVNPGPLDERHAIGLPGLPNLHSHAFQRGMAGLAERRGPGGDSFWSWRETMYRFVGRIDPDALEAIAALAFIEMLEAGFTRVGEFHYLHHDPAGHPYADPARMAQAIVAAAGQTGIGLTLLPVFYAHSGFGGAEPRPGQRRFIHDLDGFAKLIEATRRAVAALPDSELGLAAHSLRAVTPEELAALVDMDRDAPIHIHIAEQEQEVEDCLRWCGARPVEWLLDHAAVGPRWCLVHATHVNGDELAGIVRSGAVVGLCPITEANLGDGVFPASAFLAAGGRLGVGSDSNVRIDASEELRLLEYGQRLAARSRNLLASGPGSSTGGDLYRMAAAGAQVLGSKAMLSPGVSADIVSLDGGHPSLAGRRGDAILDGYIFAAGAGAIDCVWRHGRKLVTGGHHHARDAIVTRFRAVLEALVD
jgi:formiminoglutamate deiminase